MKGLVRLRLHDIQEKLGRTNTRISRLFSPLLYATITAVPD
jgi:hypothetical protein